MSKAGAPRPRYVAFRIASIQSVSRRAFGNALKGRARHEGMADAALPQLTRYRFPHGIVQCEHHELAAVRALLPRITWVVETAAKVPVQVETLLSSGTIKTLTDRLGVLADRGVPSDRKEPASRGIAAPRGGSPPRPARRGAPGRSPSGDSGRRHQGF